jgi:hypothetical protein
LVRKSERKKKLLGKPRHGWGDNTTMDLKKKKKKVRVCGQYSSGSGQGPVVGLCEYSNEFSGSIQ